MTVVQPLQRGHTLPMVEPWLRAWGQLHQNPPELLYHYTHAEGLYSIISKHNIWATDAHYLNDTSELSYIDEVIHSAVATLLSNKYHNDLPRHFLEAVDNDLLDTIRQERDIYVTSFCASGDQLSQWRGYSGAAGGYSMGFRSKDLLPPAGTPSSLLKLRRVIYEKDVQENLVREVLQGLCRWLESLSSQSTDQIVFCTCALVEAARMLSECIFCLKNPGFSEEAEWRLVHIVTGNEHLVNTPLRFRATSNGLVPYVELTPNGQQPGVLGPLPIDKVVVGPRTHQMDARNAICSFLEHSHYGKTIEVSTSAIPLRV